MPRLLLLLGSLACLPGVACTTHSEGAGERSAKEVEKGPPVCASDDDCVMSCVQEDDCCINPCGCDTVRHREVHAAVEAANAEYCRDPAHQCQVDAGGCDPSYEYATPRCVEGECTAELPAGRAQ